MLLYDTFMEAGHHEAHLTTLKTNNAVRRIPNCSMSYRDHLGGLAGKVRLLLRGTSPYYARLSVPKSRLSVRFLCGPGIPYRLMLEDALEIT